jgi:hypothetical protein
MKADLTRNRLKSERSDWACAEKSLTGSIAEHDTESDMTPYPLDHDFG